MLPPLYPHMHTYTGNLISIDTRLRLLVAAFNSITSQTSDELGKNTRAMAGTSVPPSSIIVATTFTSKQQKRNASPIPFSSNTSVSHNRVSHTLTPLSKLCRTSHPQSRVSAMSRAQQTWRLSYDSKLSYPCHPNPICQSYLLLRNPPFGQGWRRHQNQGWIQPRPQGWI